jgi:hypothetical protein
LYKHVSRIKAGDQRKGKNGYWKRLEGHTKDMSKIKPMSKRRNASNSGRELERENQCEYYENPDSGRSVKRKSSDMAEEIVRAGFLCANIEMILDGCKETTSIRDRHNIKQQRPSGVCQKLSTHGNNYNIRGHLNCSALISRFWLGDECCQLGQKHLFSIFPLSIFPCVTLANGFQSLALVVKLLASEQLPHEAFLRTPPRSPLALPARLSVSSLPTLRALETFRCD